MVLQRLQAQAGFSKNWFFQPFLQIDDDALSHICMCTTKELRLSEFQKPSCLLAGGRLLQAFQGTPGNDGQKYVLRKLELI